MALIRCPECGTKISNKAKNCLNCGYPLDVIVKNPLLNNIILDATIDQLNLSLRSYKCLKEAGVKTVRNIISMDINQFITIKNLGKKSLLEIENRLLDIGLCIHEERSSEASASIKREITKLDWKCERAPKFKTYYIIRYDFKLSELDKLKLGFLPKSMDDRWFYYYENGTVNFYRSWTGNLIFSLILNEETNTHLAIRYYDEENVNNINEADIIEILRCLLN